MKKCLQLLIIGLSGFLFSVPLSAQNLSKQSVTKVWINSETQEVDPSYLYRLGDNSIFLTPQPTMLNPPLTEYPVSDIFTLKLRRKGNIGTGILLGAAAGFLTNGIVDLLRRRHTLSACSVCPLLEEIETKKGPNRRRYIGSVLAGGVIGGVIASIKINISIGGRNDRYQYHRKELERFLPIR